MCHGCKAVGRVLDPCGCQRDQIERKSVSVYTLFDHDEDLQLYIEGVCKLEVKHCKLSHANYVESRAPLAGGYHWWMFTINSLIKSSSLYSGTGASFLQVPLILQSRFSVMLCIMLCCYEHNHSAKIDVRTTMPK